MQLISVNKSFISSIEKQPWLSQNFLEKERVSIPQIRFFVARYSSIIREKAKSKSQYSSSSNTRRSLSALAIILDRLTSSVKKREALMSFLACLMGMKVAPQSQMDLQVNILRYTVKKKFCVLQSTLQLKPSKLSKSGQQRMTSSSWQNISALVQYLLQYFRDMINSRSLTSASLLILCLSRKQKITNQSKFIPLPTPPTIISLSQAHRDQYIYEMSCLVYSQGSTLPFQLFFDMFQRKAIRAGVKDQGLSACFYCLKFQGGNIFYFVFNWSIK